MELPCYSVDMLYTLYTPKGNRMPEVTSTQAAAIIGTSYGTIHRRVDDGLLRGRRQGLNRQIWVEIDDLRQFAQQHGYKFDEDLAQEFTRK